MGQRHNYLYTSDCPHNPPGLLFTCIFVSSRLFTRLFNPMSYKSRDSIWSCVCSSLLFPNIRIWMVNILYHIESQLRFKGILVRMSLAGSVNWVVNVKVLIVNDQTLLSALRLHYMHKHSRLYLLWHRVGLICLFIFNCVSVIKTDAWCVVMHTYVRSALQLP